MKFAAAILRFFLRPLGRLAGFTVDGTHPRDPALGALLGLRAPVASGVEVTTETALGYPAYWRALSIVSNGMAKIPCHVLAQEGRKKTRAREHHAYRLVRRRTGPPEEVGGVSASQFRRTLQWHALHFGNGFAHIARDSAGRPQALTILLPDRTRLARVAADPRLPGELHDHLLYETKIAGQSRFFLPENILHIRGLGWDGRTGYPVYALLAESLGMGLAAREFGSRFFGQGATASGVITIPEGLDEEAEENFIASLKAAHAGLGKTHKFLILEEGAQFTPLTVNPEHAQFLQTRQFEVREIALIVGVQPHLLGDPGRNSYASLEQANQNHLDQDLEPWLVTWEDEYEEKLLTEEEKREETHLIEFERKALVRTNLAARTAHYASGRQWGYYSANDVRALENLDDIGPQGDTYLTPANMRPADAPYQPTPTNTPPEEAADAESRAAAAAVHSQRLLLTDTLTRIAKRLGTQARKHAKDHNAFRDWLVQAPSANASTIANMAFAAEASLGSVVGVNASPAISGFVRELFDDLTSATLAPPESLVPAVDVICTEYETWRPEKLADSLLPMPDARTPRAQGSTGGC